MKEKSLDEQIQEKWDSMKGYDCRRAGFTQEDIDFMANTLIEIIDLEVIKMLLAKKS